MKLSNIDVLNKFSEDAKKHPSIKASFRKDVESVIAKHINEMLIIRNKFRLTIAFYEWFVKDIIGKDINTKKENEFYKNFNRLKKFNIVHQKSASSFPKALSLVSINPNHFCLLSNDFEKLDIFINAFHIMTEYINKKDSNLRIYLYIYLRYFNIIPFSKKKLELMNLDDIIFISSKKSILVIPQYSFLSKGETGYELIVADNIVSSALNILKDYRGSLFPSINEYERRANDFKKKYLNNISLHSLKQINKNYHLFESTPLQLTISSKIIQTVKLTISDVISLYPKCVPMHLIEREKKILEKVFLHEKRIPTTQDSVGCSIYEIESLITLLRKKDNTPTNKEIIEVQNEIKLYLAVDNTKHANLIFMYILYILNLLLKRKLRLSSVKNYIYILNRHLFVMVEDLNNIQPYEVEQISQRLEILSYKLSTIKTIRSKIRSFFSFHRKKGFNIDMTILSYPKSLVFDFEIDIILKKIESDYIKKVAVTKIGKHHRLRILQNQAIVLIGYYFGLRKNEIRSRLIEDLYNYSNTFFIDINSEGIKKIKLKLKTSNSKRRASAEIENEDHRNILFTWIKMRGNLKNKSKFLLLSNSKNGAFLNQAVDEKIFDEISLIIKEVTNRYCTFHSLRHSFITYQYQNFNSINPYELINLSIMAGHETPITTLNSYMHSDLLEIMN